MLGLGRALGETMAVAMVLSASPVVTLNLISQHQPGDDRRQHRAELPGGDARASSRVLIATGLVLFVITFVVNFAARWIVGPQRAEVRRDDRRPTLAPDEPRVAAADRAAAAQLGAGAGRRRWRSAPPGCWPCWLGWGIVGLGWRWPLVLFLVGAAAAGRCVVEGRRASRRPARDRAGLDGLRGRAGPAGLADLDASSARACRRSTPSSSPTRCATSSARSGGVYHALIGTLLITGWPPRSSRSRSACSPRSTWSSTARAAGWPAGSPSSST